MPIWFKVSMIHDQYSPSMVLIFFYNYPRIREIQIWWRHGYPKQSQMPKNTMLMLMSKTCHVVSPMERICICIICVSITLSIASKFHSTIAFCVCDYYWCKSLHCFLEHTFWSLCLVIFLIFIVYFFFFSWFATCVISFCSFSTSFSIVGSHVWQIFQFEHTWQWRRWVINAMWPSNFDLTIARARVVVMVACGAWVKSKMMLPSTWLLFWYTLGEWA